MSGAYDGTWNGVLDSGLDRIRIAFQFHPSEDGLAGAAEVVGKPIPPIPMTIDRVDEAGIKVRIPGMGSYEASLSPERDRLIGRWDLGSASFPMVLTSGPSAAHAPRAPRPQTPREPLPYRVESMTFIGAGGDEMAGTLTHPGAGSRPPCIVLVPWMGPCDRDESVAGHKPFAVLADALTRSGLATLRYDKRGIGQSKGDYASATTHDVADDLARALAAVRLRDDVDAGAVGLLGHSEGALAAATVAASDPEIRCCALLAPPGQTGDQVLLNQMRLIASAVGGSEAHIQRSVNLDRRLYDAVRTSAGGADAIARVRAVLAGVAAREGWLKAADIERKALHVTSAWHHVFLRLDPTEVFADLRCPTLVIYGALDKQIPPELNLPPVRDALAKNHEAIVCEYPGLNHMLQPARIGVPSEYGETDQTISPEVLELIATWTTSVVQQKAVAAE